MGKNEDEALHRVLKYAAGTLVEVVPDLLQPAAEALIEEWTDLDLSRECKCDTLNCGDKGDPDAAIQSDSFATPFDIYSVENSLGIINVMARSEEVARDYVQKILDESGERTGSTITIQHVIKTIDVHVVIDEMGIVMNQLTEADLDLASNQPFEDA